MRTIEFSRDDVEQLRKAYSEAVSKDQKQFHFEGAIVLTSYAKYMLEYLDAQFGREGQTHH